MKENEMSWKLAKGQETGEQEESRKFNTFCYGKQVTSRGGDKLDKGYNFVVRIVICRHGLEQSHTTTVAAPKYRGLVDKFLFLAPDSSYGLSLLSQQCFIHNHSRGTPTSGIGSWDIAGGWSGREDSGTAFLQQGPWAEVSICTFCLGERGERSHRLRGASDQFPWFPTQWVESGRNPGEALGAGISLRHLDWPCRGAHVASRCVGSLAGVSIWF